MPLWDFDSLNSRRWKRYDKLFSRKRFIVVIVLACLLLFYLIPSIIRSLFPARVPSNEEATIQCIESFLREYHSEIEESDSSIWISHFLNHRPTALTPTTYSAGGVGVGSATTESINELTKNVFLPFVGNGKLALSPVAELDPAERRLHILGKRTLSVPVPFDPIVNFETFGGHPKSATVSRYRTGTVEHCTCVHYAGGVVSVRETFSAHRLIPSLFTQEIKVHNPTNAPLILRLSRKGWLGKPSASVKVQNILVSTTDHREYSLLVGQVFESTSTNSGHNKAAQAVAIAYPALHDSVEVKERSSGHVLSVQTFLNYTRPLEHETEVHAAVPDLKVALRETVKRVVALSPVVLQAQHEAAWRSLWWAGFSISHSHAPNAVNGYQINATLYYLLSQRAMPFPVGMEAFPGGGGGGQQRQQLRPLPELAAYSDVDVNRSRALLARPDQCYNGHSTFHAPRLWDRLDSLADLQNVVSLWFLTLEKQSCEHLLASGPAGVLQAAMLSLAALRFTSKHLEFNAHPSDLQRPYLARRLLFGGSGSGGRGEPAAAINFSVLITEDNKAKIAVAVDSAGGKESDLYACDAGCLDAPVRLSTSSAAISTPSPIEFPVKLTDPLTSLLYIAADRDHLRELKHSIHVKEIGEAPAHEHHTIALHRYGHSLGGLPTFFWVTICFLIVVFHLFLGKLIYSEYFANGGVGYERLNRNQGRYSM